MDGSLWVICREKECIYKEDLAGLWWDPPLKLSHMITQGNPGHTLGFENLGYFWQIIFVFHQHLMRILRETQGYPE